MKKRIAISVMLCLTLIVSSIYAQTQNPVMMPQGLSPTDTVTFKRVIATEGTITTSQPAVSSTATWNAGGVTFVHELHNVTDTASAAGSLLLDYQVGGASKYSVSKAGLVTAGDSVVATANLQAGATGTILFNTRSKLTSGADGQITLLNAAGSDFARLNFGGTTSSFPAIKRTGTGLLVRLADDSGAAALTVGALTAGDSSITGFRSAVTTTTAAAYAVLDSDSNIFGDATAEVLVFTLPAAATRAGKEYRFVKIDASANTITVDGNSAETINGAANKVMAAQYDGFTIVSDGTTWFVIK